MKHVKLFEQFVNEGNWAKMMSGVKKNSETGPWSIIAVEGNKVVGQEIDIKTKEMIPASYEALKREYPKAKLHIEDATGAVVWNESKLNEAKGKDLIKVQKLDWTDHTRLIKWLSTEMDKKVNLEVVKTGGYIIDPSNLDDEEVEALMSYLKSQRYLV